MKKIFYIIALLAIISGCGDSKEMGSNLTTIVIDTDTEIEMIDLSSMLEDSFEIINLEINEHCMVSRQNVKIVTDKYIFVANRITNTLSVFDNGGKFLTNVGRQGQGPGEYSRLDEFTLVADSIYLPDGQQSKIIVYPIIGDGYREIDLNPAISYSALFSTNKKLYFITNYSHSGDDKYFNLVSMDLANNISTRDYLPYDKDIYVKNQSWELTKFSSQYMDSTLMMLARNDTIYSIVNDELSAKYFVDIVNHKITSELLSNDGTIILLTAMKEGYITGLNTIYNTKNYVFGEFSKGTDTYDMIYTKGSGKTEVSKRIRIKDFGDLQVLDYITTDNDEFISLYDPMILKDMWENNYSKSSFVNPAHKEKMREVIENLKDDDNPVLMKFKFKKL